MNRPPNPLRAALWLVTVLAAALLQATWPDLLKLQGVVPDLVLLMVVYIALTDGEERAMYTAAIGGIYQDVATNAVLGHHVLCLVIVAYGIGRLSNRLVTEHPAIKAGLVLLGGVAEGLLYVMVLYVQNPAVGAITMILASAVPAAFYTALLTPFVFPVLGRLFPRPEPPLYGSTVA
jgi:rod shape-determining protein MreD